MLYQKIHEEPRLSINKLGEYMTATNPSRRRQILREQKFPPTTHVARYADAERALARHFVAGQDVALLSSAQRELVAAPPTSSWDAERRRNCVAAIAQFARAPRFYPLDARFIELPSTLSALRIADVQLSVRPNLLVKCSDGELGLLKLHFSKSHRLSEHGGEYVAALLCLFAEHTALPIAKRRVRVLDVFAGQYFGPPRAFKRGLENLRAACEEIASRWRDIAPRKAA